MAGERNKHGKVVQMQFLDLQDVLNLVNLGRSTIYRMIREQKFPKPTKLGKRATRWTNTDIEHWISQRILAS
jgi:prophage regulatory protein